MRIFNNDGRDAFSAHGNRHHDVEMLATELPKTPDDIWSGEHEAVLGLRESYQRRIADMIEKSGDTLVFRTESEARRRAVRERIATAVLEACRASGLE